jgi:hypothetical protein
MNPRASSLWLSMTALCIASEPIISLLSMVVEQYHEQYQQYHHQAWVPRIP